MLTTPHKLIANCMKMKFVELFLMVVEEYQMIQPGLLHAAVEVHLNPGHCRKGALAGGVSSWQDPKQGCNCAHFVIRDLQQGRAV